MTHSLISFHFNPIKLGQICKQYAKDRGISQAIMAARTGLSYDTVGNIYAGKVQKIPLEYVFKFCVVLGIPIEVLMMLMLKDESIDFADQVLLYDTVDDKAVPVEDVVPSMVAGSVPESVADAAASAPPMEAVHHDAAHTCHIHSDQHALVEILNAAHALHTKDLKEQFDKERETTSRHIDQLHKLIESLSHGY